MCYLKLYQLTPYQCPLPEGVLKDNMTDLAEVAVSVFFAAPDTGQMHIQFSFEICPMPKRQQKKSHDRRLVALATHHVFKLFYLKYDLFNFHYGYQQSLMYMLYQKLTEVSTYL